VIRGAKKVAYEKVVKIIDIAQRNKLKMVLAVKVSGK
jgi:biopolymer transport protein ExbD